MKKKFTTICAFCLAALFAAGCSNSSEIKPPNSKPPETESSNSTSSEAESLLGNGISVKGICGEDITVVDFLERVSNKFDVSILGPDFSAYSYEGFGYYSPSDGQVGIKPNCEPFNEEPFIEYPTPVYQHIDVGDKVGGLELKSASGTLFDIDGELSLEQQVLCFSGSLKLKGYIRLCIESEVFGQEGDLMFYPSDKAWKDLPFNSYNWSTEYLGENHDFYWCGNVPVINLGKVSDQYYPEISEISNEPKEVTVTISDLVLKCCFTDMFFGIDSYINSATLDNIIFI